MDVADGIVLTSDKRYFYLLFYRRSDVRRQIEIHLHILSILHDGGHMSFTGPLTSDIPTFFAVFIPLYPNFEP